MARLTLVRHGQAAAGWAEDLDPELSDLGRVQAEAAAAVLSAGDPVPVLSSPLRRTRQTAAPLAEAWSTMVRLEDRLGEIPSPTDDLAGRAAWLAGLFGSDWSDADKATRVWRLDVLDHLLTLADDAVLFTHYVAINVAVGHATGDPRVFCFAPDYCSRTVLDNRDGRLVLVERGDEASTTIR